MGSTAKVIKRMDQRVEELSSDIPHWLHAFNSAEKFSGPSLYFHLRTLECLRSHPSSVDALHSDEFFDWLYATLASWGMHRMGEGMTKLKELSQIKTSVRAQVATIEKLHPLRLTDLSDVAFQPVLRQLWLLVSAFDVSIAKANIVANSKVLHHILPNLVPPIDRTYTYKFFYNRNTLSIPEEDAFGEMLSRLHKVAVMNKKILEVTVRSGWNSSQTKILDNALVGYVIEVLRVEKE